MLELQSNLIVVGFINFDDEINSVYANAEGQVFYELETIPTPLTISNILPRKEWVDLGDREEDTRQSLVNKEYGDITGILFGTGAELLIISDENTAFWSKVFSPRTPITESFEIDFMVEADPSEYEDEVNED
jgi:hypothetical protein